MERVVRLMSRTPSSASSRDRSLEAWLELVPRRAAAATKLPSSMTATNRRSHVRRSISELTPPAACQSGAGGCSTIEQDAGCHEAAIHIEDLAVDEGGRIGGQEGDRGGNFRRRGIATEGDA